MLQEFLMPILEQDGPDDMPFQQDGALPHFHKEVTDVLIHKFPDKFIGGRWDYHLATLFPDTTPFIFSFWGASGML
jgi:hypothetical protein